MIDPRRHEGRHPPAEDPAWREWWGFDFVAPDHDLAGWSELVLFPGAGTAWYHAFVVGADRDLVAVFDHEVPYPDPTLEIRTTGLWADHICETPGEHWTLGLEAFGVGLDDPGEMYGRQLGEQVPLGFDLEWECDDPAGSMPAVDGAEGYSLDCRVSGEVLVGAEAIDLDGTGTRRHRWGVPDDATATVAGRPVAATDLTVDHRSDGVPRAVSLLTDGEPTPLDIVATTPLAVPDPAGPRRRPRALVAAAPIVSDGWTWVDWTEISL